MKIKYLIPTKEAKENTENMIFLDDSFGDSIFRRFNKGLNLVSDADYVVFMHDDVTILDQLFEQKVKAVFNKFESIAILGVIGTRVFTANGGWWTCDRRTETNGHIIQGRSDGSDYHMIERIGFCKDMVTVDGCCFIVRNELLKSKVLKFDARYQGFHFYDADICVQAKHNGFDVAVADILIRHESEGPMNETWFSNRALFLNKWADAGYSFPLTCESFKKVKYE